MIFDWIILKLILRWEELGETFKKGLVKPTEMKSEEMQSVHRVNNETPRATPKCGTAGGAAMEREGTANTRGQK